MDGSESPAELEAPNFWVLKTEISGHRPPQGALTQGFGTSSAWTRPRRAGTQGKEGQQ